MTEYEDTRASQESEVSAAGQCTNRAHEATTDIREIGGYADSGKRG